jgi:hypothetical protein
MPSRSANSLMVLNLKSSSIRFFQRKGRASAFTSVLSVVRGCWAPSGICIYLRPSRFVRWNGMYTVSVFCTEFARIMQLLLD